MLSPTGTGLPPAWSHQPFTCTQKADALHDTFFIDIY
jgi:hypothetical protein